jgi:hypothetical protein
LVLKGFALGLPFDAAAQVPIALMTRALQFARRTVTDTVPTLIGTAVTIGVIIAGHPLPGLVAGQVAGAVARAVVAMAIGPRYRPGWSTAMMRKLLSYGGYLSAADMLNFGLLNVDYITVGHVLGPVALGYYSLAYRICFMPYLSISVVANGAVFPYYCRLPTREAKARTAESTLSLINAVSIPWFAGLVLFAGDIGLLGHKWAPAVGAVRFLAVYGFFLSAILGALQILKAVGRTDLVFFGRGAHLAVLTAVLVLTVRGGITVVALDQAVVAAGIAAVTGYWTVRYASLRAAAVDRAAHPRPAGPGSFRRQHSGRHAGAAAQGMGDAARALGPGHRRPRHGRPGHGGPVPGQRRDPGRAGGRPGTAKTGRLAGSPLAGRRCGHGDDRHRCGFRRGALAGARRRGLRRGRPGRRPAVPPRPRGGPARGRFLLQQLPGPRRRAHHH